ncbi:MAG: oxygen-dependent coproporphyrinogen oxidase [Bradymonadales bacterium]|nr:MAG: oxygen-dependent coproporphyrinogen oxidase [Bradymonadales bacterium]
MRKKESIASWFRELQSKIIEALEVFEPKIRFESHPWKRPGGGGGDSRILAEGEVFEKAGVNVSEVEGELPPSLMAKLETTSSNFYATGLSLVIHPRSPQVPTVHANWRYFEQSDRRWFGGGADLTPFVFRPEDFRHFHESLRRPCDRLGPKVYDEFKQKCDEYFYLPHRKEHRGIGGIFFDYLSENLDQVFEFIKESGMSLIDAYIPIVQKRHSLSFSEREKDFQWLRRGRYVEFNLIYDRGTKFGLETQGNTESILMSLPPKLSFEFQPELEKTESEKELMKAFRNPKNWLAS